MRGLKINGRDEMKMIDGNGSFSKGMGMRDGFGPRWRYSMLVCDGVIEARFLSPFEVSDAMLEAVKPTSLFEARYVR